MWNKEIEQELTARGGTIHTVSGAITVRKRAKITMKEDRVIRIEMAERDRYIDDLIHFTTCYVDARKITHVTITY